MTRNSHSLYLLSTSLIIGFSLHADPVFYFKNKSKGTVFIEFSQGDSTLTKGLKKVSKGNSFKGGDQHTTDPSMSQETKLWVHMCTTFDACNAPHDILGVKFSPGKKIYVKFNGSKILPQKGIKGTQRTQNLLYNLDNNVTENDIKLIKPIKTTSDEDTTQTQKKKIASVTIADLLHIPLKSLNDMFVASKTRSIDSTNFCTACAVLGVTPSALSSASTRKGTKLNQFLKEAGNKTQARYASDLDEDSEDDLHATIERAQNTIENYCQRHGTTTLPTCTK